MEVSPMARGVRKSIDEKIAELKVKKENVSTKINELKKEAAEIDKQISELSKQKYEEELGELYEFMVSKGLSVADVKKKLG